MRNRIVFNKQHIKYLFPQRTRLTTEYALTEDSTEEQINSSVTLMAEKDYNMIRNYLPTSCGSILDIGCGVALVDILLYRHYSGDAHLHLLDKTENDTSKISGFNSTYKFYNSMNATRETLLSNGVDANKIHLHEADNMSDLHYRKHDLICSFLSCGWHYPIQTYLSLIEDTLLSGGIFIVDIRHGTNQLSEIENSFELVKQIYNYAESKHTGGNIGDRYVFRRR